jgi:putative ABC transport system permease protein
MSMRGGIWPILTTVPDPKSPQRFVVPDLANQTSASLRYVTPGFFQTIGTPIVEGRDVSESDSLQSQVVAVISRSFAKQQYPGQDPIGQQFAMAFSVRTIVGVVGDIRVRGLERDSEPQVYLPAAQQPDATLSFYIPKDLVIRASVPASNLIPATRQVIWQADPQQPITSVRLLSDVVADETASRVVQLRVVGAFGAVAVVLAAIGIHGLLAFSVASRVREIAVRIALGASSGDILRIVVGRGAILAGVGVALGSVLAFATGRSMQALLAGVDPADVGVFATAVGVSVVMAVAGALAPAMRAVRVDPLTATRAE